jgi:hypothetical protein
MPPDTADLPYLSLFAGERNFHALVASQLYPGNPQSPLLAVESRPASKTRKILYGSGGRSIHALVRVDAICKEQWDQIVRHEIGPVLVPLGVCMESLTAVRLCRLPHFMRIEKGRLQQLFLSQPES